MLLLAAQQAAAVKGVDVFTRGWIKEGSSGLRSSLDFSEHLRELSFLMQ